MRVVKLLKESWANFFGKNYTIGKNSREFVDEENYGWEALRREAIADGAYSYGVADLEELRLMSQFLYRFSTHYHGLVNTYLKYVFGKNYIVTSEVDRENGAWADFQKEKKWRKFLKELGRRYYRDGEVIVYTPTWKFINPALLQSPSGAHKNIVMGVEEDEEDATRPVAYWIVQGREIVRIPSEEIIYVGDCDQDEHRSIPYFLSVLTKCRNYDQWLKDRILLNRARAMICVERIHTGSSPSQGATFADAKKTTAISDRTSTWGESQRRKILQSGAIIDHSDSIKYQYLAPNVDARDVAEDGRKIVLAIAAATGLPEYMISGDSSNANYASHLVSESAAIKEFDSQMEFFAEVILEIWRAVQEQAGNKAIADAEIEIPIISVKDKEKESRAALTETQKREILFQNGIISFEEWREEEGYEAGTKKVKRDFADLQ
jgi:hypothetical protein